MDTKKIRIIDGHYNLQFLVEDGGYISVDGKPYQLRYLDETHFDIAGRCYHICQFGELVTGTVNWALDVNAVISIFMIFAPFDILYNGKEQVRRAAVDRADASKFSYYGNELLTVGIKKIRRSEAH